MNIRKPQLMRNGSLLIVAALLAVLGCDAGAIQSSSPSKVVFLDRAHQTCIQPNTRMNPVAMKRSELQELLGTPATIHDIDSATEAWTYTFSDGDVVLRVIRDRAYQRTSRDPSVFVDPKCLVTSTAQK